MLQWDYDSVFTRLKDRLKTKAEARGEDLSDILFYGTNSLILQAVAETIAKQAEYDEYLTNEAKWDNAQNYSSILSQTSFYRYSPHRKIGATGSVKVSTDSGFAGDYPTPVILPKYSVFSNQELYFVSTTERILSPGQDYITVTIIQGIPKSTTYDITLAQYPDGTEYAEIEILNDSIEDTLYDVYINGMIAEEITHIREAEDRDSLVYTVKNKLDFSGIVFGFGNDVFGKKLEYGDTVTIKYVETEGRWGNVLAANNITSVEGTFTDINSVPVTLYCANTAQVAGGSDYEEEESIKAFAPKSFQSGGNIITTADYISAIRNTGLTDKEIVWGEKEVNEDLGNPPGTFIPAEENLTYVSAINIDPITGTGSKISEATETLIREALNELKGPTDIIQFVDTELIGVKFDSDIYISDKTYTLEEVKGNVETDLINEYKVENVEYRNNLYFSEYQSLIQQSEGVDHHQTDISFVSLLTFDSAYVFNLALNINNIKEGSVSIYVRNPSESDEWILMAQDDGSTNLIGQPTDPNNPESLPFELPGAQIDYSDGLAGDIIVTFGLTADYSQYEIKVEFEVDETVEGDLLLTKRQQVFYYYDSNITPHAVYVG